MLIGEYKALPLGEKLNFIAKTIGWRVHEWEEECSKYCLNAYWVDGGEYYAVKMSIWLPPSIWELEGDAFEDAVDRWIDESEHEWKVPDFFDPANSHYILEAIAGRNLTLTLTYHIDRMVGIDLQGHNFRMGLWESLDKVWETVCFIYLQAIGAFE